jgi:hypothetical protein
MPFIKSFATKWLNLNNRGRKAHGREKEEFTSHEVVELNEITGI